VLRPTRPSQPPVSITGAEVHALPHISVAGLEEPAALAEQPVIAGLARVDSLVGLHRLLTDLVRIAPTHAATLDLIGPSTGTGVLQLGRSAIDATNPAVLDLFEAIGEEQLVHRLAIRAVRLLGARTATEQLGQDTLRRLRQFLGVPVLGTTSLLSRTSFGEHGLDRALDNELVDDRAAPARKPVVLPTTAPRTRPFGFDAVGIVKESALLPVTWPRFVVPRGFDLKTLTNQIRAGDGQALPGLLALPRCELLIPAGRMLGEERFRVLEVLFNWELVRVQGPTLPEAATYPVVSPQRFTRLVNLPQYQP